MILVNSYLLITFLIWYVPVNKWHEVYGETTFNVNMFIAIVLLFWPILLIISPFIDND